MPINNINTLQNFEDLKYTTELAKQSKSGELNTDYYIHSLANLEQRNEYRYSNGIKYGVITYDNDVVISSDNNRSTTALEFNNDVAFDIYVNNIEVYLHHSQLYNDNKTFKSLLLGKRLGTDDTDETQNVEIQYTEIDLSNHTIINAYRVFYLNDANYSDAYILLHLYKTSASAVTHKYKLKVYSLSFDKIVEPTIKLLFRASTYRSSLSNNIRNYIDVNSTKLFDDLIQECSIYSTSVIDNNYTLDCEYDTVDEQNIKITNASLMSGAHTRINELLYFNHYNIDQYVNAINNDLTVTYPNLVKYYSDMQFNSNFDTMKMMIAYALYDELYNEAIINVGATLRLRDDSTDDNFVLTIPRGTTITYISNVENALQLYYTDDIYVYLTSNKYNVKSLTDISPITFTYKNAVDKTVIYNIYSKYNTKYTEFVNSFEVYKKYVLPYIDDSHLWNMNDTQTSIYASGESAGNPNILLINTSLSTGADGSINITEKRLNRLDIQDNLLNYSTEHITIKHTNETTHDTRYYTYAFRIPIIDKKSADKLKYATLFAMSNVTISSNGDYNDNSPMMTTIWTISDPNNGDVKFEPVFINDNDPLTFEDMFGVSQFIYNKFAEYGHISNIFDDLIALRLPRTTLNGSEIDNSGFFVIERNTKLDSIGAEHFDENSYNYNLVEMKINNVLDKSEYSYATASHYDSKNRLLNEWANNDRPTKQIYRIGDLTISRSVTPNPPRNAVSIDSVDNGTGTTDELLSQAVSSSNIRSDMNNVSERVAVAVYDAEFVENSTDMSASTYTPLNEFLPRSYVPILKESNLMHQDHNIINRSNLYSFEEHTNATTNKIYYAYIGTSCQSPDKSTLHIGTADTSYMINLGKESLVSPMIDDNEDLFAPTNALAIDMPYTYINSTVTTIHNAHVDGMLMRHKYDDIEQPITTLSLNHLNILYNEEGATKNIIANVYRNNSWSNIPSGNNITYFNGIQFPGETITLKKYFTEKYTDVFKNVNTVINMNKYAYVSGSYLPDKHLMLFTTPLLVNIIGNTAYIN